MKKIISVIMALTLAGSLLLSGCGNSGANETKASSKEASQAASNGSSSSSASSGAAEDASWEKVQSAGTMVLGLDDAFPPMGFRDEKNEIVGFDIDVAKEVCKRLGIELKLQPIDWDSKSLELNSGKIDCIWNGLTITEERSKEVNFTDPYMQNRQVVIVRGDSAIKTLADLEGKVVALQAASSAADALSANPEVKDSLGEIVELSDNVTAFLDLETQISDAVLMDEVVAAYYIAKNNKDFVILDEALAEETYGVGFRKGDQALRDKVNNELKAMSEDGTLTKISETWFGRDVTVIK